MKKFQLLSFGFMTTLLFGGSIVANSLPYKIYQFNSVKWAKEFPGLKLPPGVKVAVLDGNPTKAEPFIMRIKFPPNFKLQPHTHPNAEHATVMQGIVNFGYGPTFDKTRSIKISRGGFVVIQPNTPHYGYAGKEGAIIQINSIGPWVVNFVKQN